MCHSVCFKLLYLAQHHTSCNHGPLPNLGTVLKRMSQLSRGVDAVAGKKKSDCAVLLQSRPARLKSLRRVSPVFFSFRPSAVQSVRRRVGSVGPSDVFAETLADDTLRQGCNKAGVTALRCYF